MATGIWILLLVTVASRNRCHPHRWETKDPGRLPAKISLQLVYNYQRDPLTGGNLRLLYIVSRLFETIDDSRRLPARHVIKIEESKKASLLPWSAWLDIGEDGRRHIDYKV